MRRPFLALMIAVGGLLLIAATFMLGAAGGRQGQAVQPTLAGSAVEVPTLTHTASPTQLTASPAASTSPVPRLSPAPLITPTSTPNLHFSGEEALRHVEAQMAFGSRPTGSDASRQTAAYILQTLEDYGWETETRPFVYQGVEGQNLVGRAGLRSGPVYIFGAHYDTRRQADQDPMTPSAPVPGANDGASGVAVLLELARVIDREALDGEVWLVFFDAEDNGRLDGWEYAAGSRIFVQGLEVVPEYAVIVDMVGDTNQDIYLEGNSDPVLRAHLWAIAAGLGYGSSIIAQPRHSLLDDHMPFLEAGIPAVDIIDFDYPSWHTTQDTLDKVSAQSLERVGRTLEQFLSGGGGYPRAPADER
jgi:hypothetical protein